MLWGAIKAPLVTFLLQYWLLENMPNLHLILCGDETVILKHFNIKQFTTTPRLTILPTTQVVAMDDKPIVALRTKKDSSMRKALRFSS